jgi:curved DNA-binding protein CbpA
MLSRSCWRWAPAVEDVVAAFKILGLTFNPHAPVTNRPGVDDVRRQYRELARLHHPDLSSGDDNRMKVINTAYELIQSSGVLQGAYDPSRQGADGGSDTTGGAVDASATTRFTRKAGTHRRRFPDDFANGDDASWSMKTQLDWQSMMNSTDSVTEEEMKNPANHPFSHSRFFSFEDDLSIYRMLRGGATVRQVARTLGKPATFVERRLQNAQFKLRVQYVLRQEKKKTTGAAAGASVSSPSAKGGSGTAAGHTTSTPITEPTTRRVLRRSPYEDVSRDGRQPPQPGHNGAQFSAASCAGGGASCASTFVATGTQRKKEWEASYPEWRAPRYRDQMTLEEQGRWDGLLRDVTSETHGGKRNAAEERRRRGAVSKVGRSYENFRRMHPS